MTRYIEESEVKRMIIRRGWMSEEELENSSVVADLPSAQPSVPDRKVGKWIVVERHEHYPSGKPYEQVQCPFCKRFDNNGDGSFCGYCGARMKGEEDVRESD